MCLCQDHQSRLLQRRHQEYLLLQKVIGAELCGSKHQEAHQPQMPLLLLLQCLFLSQLQHSLCDLLLC